MSRNTERLTSTITCYYGDDHAIGSFIDIVDSRYEDHPDDDTGEGFLMEWCQMFGFMTNKIGVSVDDLKDTNVLIQKVEAFIETLDLDPEQSNDPIDKPYCNEF